MSLRVAKNSSRTCILLDVSTDATLGLLMKPALLLVLIGWVALPACTSARLSHDEARKKIAAIGQSSLVPDTIEIRRIVSQSDTSAIAESTVTLAFQFKRPNTNSEWRIEAVRLGDRDWISLDELIAGINEGRRRTTVQAMQEVAAGIEKYRSVNGTLPAAKDIVSLTDILYPMYMSRLIREDGWGKPIIYETMGTTFRLVSGGADGRRGTPDDVVVENSRSGTP
jgi:Type II secretion system (T2SS), protein G